MPARFLLGFLLAIFGFFLCSQPTLAVPSITITSVPDTLTVGQPFDLNISVSGLTTNFNYYGKIRLGTPSATLNQGQTYNSLNNSPDDWLNDTGDSWTKFPQITSDSSGNWSGILTGRPSESAFAGLNYILFRVKKADSSSATYDSATVSAIISPAANQQTDSPADQPSPNITVNIGNNFILGREFNIGIKLENFDSNQDYYLKFRAGTDENSLAKGQTKNGSAFYADNESWSKFPQIKTDGSGKWDRQISARIGEDKPVGQYTIRIRVRKKDADTFYDSGTKNISLSSPPVATEDITQVSSVTSQTKTVAATNPADNINLVLGTASAATKTPVPTQVPESPKSQISNKPGIIPVAIVFISLGAILSSAALLSVKFKIWEKWLIKV